ncbi:hypothetical protein DFH06DRAFT_1165675 [Mycena polygramma]|nr:hypothetical protein DFH06DRAFT_1165675 [Mycena polygramma]
MALACLAKIVASNQFEYSPYFADRIAEAWPEIRAWLHYTFTDWISSGKFIGRQKEDRIHGYRGIIPFIEALCRVPDLRQLLLRTPSERQNLFLVLSFCWQMESEDWFVMPQSYAPFTSAATPLAMLAEAFFHSVKQDDLNEFFIVLNLVAAGAKLDPSRIAEMSMDHLKDTASLSLPALASHIGMLTVLGRERSYTLALFAQHSFQRVIQILDDLTSDAHNPTTAEEVAACIHPCLMYLAQSIQASDGCSFVAEALRRDILAVLFRSSEWIAPDHPGCLYLAAVLHLISVYTIYPSVFLPFMEALGKAPDDTEDPADLPNQDTHPIQHQMEVAILTGTYRYLNQLIIKPDSSFKCMNPECGEAEIDVLKDTTPCSECFIASYCSEACRKAHWTASHKEDCETWINARNGGIRPPILPRDIEYACDVAIAAVQASRGDIARVWKTEMPWRTPLVSVDYTQDLRGLMSIGEECLTTMPRPIGSPVLDPVEFKAMWEAERSKGFHDEHVLVGIFLPHGTALQTHWRWIPINPEYTEGTVVERLIQTVEFLESEGIDIDAITNE